MGWKNGKKRLFQVFFEILLPDDVDDPSQIVRGKISTKRSISLTSLSGSMA
jgi:hypothetical protein